MRLQNASLIHGVRQLIAIDWSGAKIGAAERIWIASTYVRSAHVSLENGRDRDEAIRHVLRLAAVEPRTVVGIDFAFSFPEWFVRRQGAKDTFAMWDIVAHSAETWLAQCPHPFWGRNGRLQTTRNAELYRRTERSMPNTKSVFQLYYPGAVGTGSLRGMSYLTRLRAKQFSIWPFEDPKLPIVVEIFPRYFTGRVRKNSAPDRRTYLSGHDFPRDTNFQKASDSPDAFDALVSVVRMEQLLGESRDPFALPPDPACRLEGWIWPSPTSGDPPATAPSLP